MSKSLHLFEGYGIELEYMIADKKSLKVSPTADRLIKMACGAYEEEIERGLTCWSNELPLHVIELKTNGPTKSLADLGLVFSEQVTNINTFLKEWNAVLMPTAMHPFMIPDRDLKLWPHSRSEVYEAYNRIFNCKGHGWSNLQSMHINLPFADDKEFEALHAAIRVLLPILPALAASSPVVEGKLTGKCDTRLTVYEGNQKRVPSIAGSVIPEQVWSQKQYDERISECIYRDIKPLDPEGTLQHEWLNSRGAIARFDRNAIEIRVLDMQECPKADIAIATIIVAVLKELCSGDMSSKEKQKDWDEKSLKAIFDSCVIAGSQTVIANGEYLALFGMKQKSCTAKELWSHFIERCLPKHFPTAPTGTTEALVLYLREGTLSERIQKSIPHGSVEEMSDVYRQLCRCLGAGEFLKAA